VIKETSATILERFRRDHGRDINLTIRQSYLDLLAALDHPHNKLPPVFHVAGTNGKGSTCAFLRSILEAAGYKVHVYTSPHLVRFHERIRIAGKLIEEEELVETLSLCEKLSRPGEISYFEAATAAAFVAFARNHADFTILETGLGGRLDATNVVAKPLATVITRLSFDHREYLGNTIAQIAREKAGIMRPAVPCFTAPQPDQEALSVLQQEAEKHMAPLFIGNKDWRINSIDHGFRFVDRDRTYELPAPILPGEHQFLNAGLAIAALQAAPIKLTSSVITEGLQKVDWPARLQQLRQGVLAKTLPNLWELWLDGGHNDSAGEVLAAQARAWAVQDAKPLSLILGMLTTKKPDEFLRPLLPYLDTVQTVAIPDETLSFSAEVLATQTTKLGIKDTRSSIGVAAALSELYKQSNQPRRILIAGSLYLAGHVLRLNGA